jgi:Cu(I)/Ag(I) efflux system protein CusF
MKAVAIAAALMMGFGLAHAGETASKDRAATHDQAAANAHKATGVVKKLDAKGGTVTIAHEPVKELKWPAMTMPFKVQDKALIDKLGEGKKVDFEFEQRGKDAVITAVK